MVFKTFTWFGFFPILNIPHLLTTIWFKQRSKGFTDTVWRGCVSKRKRQAQHQNILHKSHYRGRASIFSVPCYKISLSTLCSLHFVPLLLQAPQPLSHLKFSVNIPPQTLLFFTDFRNKADSTAKYSHITVWGLPWIGMGLADYIHVRAHSWVTKNR